MSLGGLPAISKVFYSLIHINISSWVNSVSDWLFGELFFFFTFWLPGFFWVGGSYFCFSPFSPPYKYVFLLVWISFVVASTCLSVIFQTLGLIVTISCSDSSEYHTWPSSKWGTWFVSQLWIHVLLLSYFTTPYKWQA